jgi:hypothetical protein
MDRTMYNLLIRLDEKSLFETKWVCNSIFPKKTAILKQTVPYYLMTTNTLQYMTNPVRQVLNLSMFKLPDMRQYRNYADFLVNLTFNILFIVGLGLFYTTSVEQQEVLHEAKKL